MISVSTIIGLVGSAVIMSQYILNMMGKIKVTSISYPALNSVASLMILYSLWFRYNPPSFYVEIFWFLASFYGLIRNIFKKIKEDKSKQSIL